MCWVYVLGVRVGCTCWVYVLGVYVGNYAQDFLLLAKYIEVKKKNLFINYTILKSKQNSSIIFLCGKESYFGSKYIFNKIINSNVKKNGDKTSELLIRANYIRDVNGCYNILPLGLRVIYKIINFLNKELTKLNSHCVSLSILQSKKIWNQSNRSKLYGDEFLYVYKQKLHKGDKNIDEGYSRRRIEDDGHILSPTCEESSLCLLNEVFSENITEKCLPILIHQYNYKFRNEKRTEKSLFKSKEFLMKDGYSFHSNDKCLNETYEIYKQCYKNIFKKLKLTCNLIKKRKKDKMNALESHEFQIASRDGKLKEIAHIFKLGNYYSHKMDIYYRNKKNEQKNILMGSYGIGIYRLLYLLVDNFYDEDGIKLPEHIAPFTVYLIQANQKSKYSAEKISKIVRQAGGHAIGETAKGETAKGEIAAQRPLSSNDVECILTHWVFNTFRNNNVDIYYDDTDLHLSRKLKNCDFIGVPNRVIINLNSEDKKIKLPTDFYNYIDCSKNVLLNKLFLIFQNVTVEYKNRFSHEAKMMTIKQLFSHFDFV
ncbi:proline--tRNA ligase, putative (aPRS) [Plasmodium ovale wallikeri]|uniref:Proline--tRNA ligase, putative (APRS) n=1 Tax=Plasmodium ovale wallikeri TaxID=864142 RepID=A0A1A8YQE9_PLAOA|nr:proline--tRNA ligase, putative (aPRS) [Plasmodium ovale wallikeri]SBT34073.1 proline--tRNA ligase, putative (aPRS) [Plasmodium ovale wallikeri]